MSESNDYKTLKKNLPKGKDRFDRIENLVLTGMPDINYCFDGIEGWIELKNPTEPKRATTKLFASNHKLSQDQKNWFKRQIDAGGNCWVIIATDRMWYLIHGTHADSINEMTIDEILEYSHWTVCKPIKNKNFWELLRNQLRNC